jgi:hypothetical protein
VDAYRSNLEEDGEHVGLLLKRKIKMRRTAPIEIQESATLKEGQCQPFTLTSKKSMTYPLKTRPMKLPKAPAIIRDKDIFNHFSSEDALIK